MTSFVSQSTVVLLITSVKWYPRLKGYRGVIGLCCRVFVQMLIFGTTICIVGAATAVESSFRGSDTCDNLRSIFCTLISLIEQRFFFLSTCPVPGTPSFLERVCTTARDMGGVCGNSSEFWPN